MAESAQHKRDVHGHTVFGDDDAKHGIDYLDHDLQHEEAKVFFEQARVKGSAEFEDDQDRNFTLTHNSDGTYTIEKRKASGGGLFGGWF